MKKIIILIISIIILIALISVLIRETKMAQITIKSITITEKEEEGGRLSKTYFPNGYIKVELNPGHGGYLPLIEQGWYKIKNISQLQILYNKVAESVKKDKPSSSKERLFGSWTEISVNIGNKTIYLNDKTIEEIEAMDIEIETQSTQTSKNISSSSTPKKIANLSDTPTGKDLINNIF